MTKTLQNSYPQGTLATRKQVKLIAKLAASHPHAKTIVETAKSLTITEAAQLIDILTFAPALLAEFLAQFDVTIKTESVFNKSAIMKRAWTLYRKTVAQFPDAATRTTFGLCLRLAWKEARRQLALVRLMYLDLSEDGLRPYLEHFDDVEVALSSLPVDRAPAGAWRERFSIAWYEQQCLLTVISWIAAAHGFGKAGQQYPQVEMAALVAFFRWLMGQSESV